MKPDRRSTTPVATHEFSLSGSELTDFVRGGVDSVHSLVNTTYGPRGMDKLVQLNGSKNEIVVELTSSGQGVLDAIDRGDGFSHPVAAILVDAVDTMHRELHDGTTAAIILTTSLLNRGYELLEQGLAPSDVLVGYALAAEEVGRIYDDLSRPVSYEERDLLVQVTETMLTCRFGDEPDEQYVDLVVDAIQGLAAASDGDWIDTKQVKVIADQGVVTDLHRGVIITRWPRGAESSDRSLVDFDWDPQFAEPVEDATVAIIDREIEITSSGTNFGQGSYSGINLDSSEAVQRYHAGYEQRKRDIAAHVASLGVDVLVSKPRVDDDLIGIFDEHGVEIVDKVDTPERDIDRLATATGATVVTRPDDLTADHMGTAGRVFDHRATDEKWTHVTDCEGHAYTLTVGRHTEHAAEHVVAVLEDALEVAATAAIDGQVLPGAGAAQMTAAAAIRDAVSGVGGREALAMSAFGAALEDSVRTLAGNAGLDTIDEIAGLRAVRANGEGDTIGLDVVTGQRVDAWNAGIVEPRRIPSQALETARTTAIRFLTTDALLHPNTSLDHVTPQTEHR